MGGVGRLFRMSNINDFFTSNSINSEGELTMVSYEEKNNKSFYLTNFYGDKLLKISLKSEPSKSLKEVHAQIKIIGYGVKSAHVWKDQPNDPSIERIFHLTELTYHGVCLNEKKPKIHIKAQSGYKTLIDDILHLPSSIDLPVPLFAMEPGYRNLKTNADIVKKKSHVISTEKDSYERIDFYLASADMNFDKFINSMYFFNIFWTQNYLATATNNELTSGKIIAPINFLRIGEFILIVRRSLSIHQGRPRLIFYNNKNYYDKLMSRSLAYKRQDGTIIWSTMAEEEMRFCNE